MWWGPRARHAPGRLAGHVRRIALALIVLSASADFSRAGEINEAQALTLESYATLKAAIAPSPAECVWREIGWLPTFGEAVAEARRAGKPIFLWAMNGHPLACV